MNNLTKNLVLVLGVILTLGVGYFFITQDFAMFTQDQVEQQQLERLFASSELFVERSRVLSSIEMDTAMFGSETFNSLQSFSSEPAEYAFGRTNPFSPATAVTQSVTNQTQ